jgi:hypothetical protein
MALYGSSVPIEGLTTGAMVVTVICPNAYSHQRLMQALLSIVPDAGHVPLVVDGDEPIGPGGCAGGACGVD